MAMIDHIKYPNSLPSTPQKSSYTNDQQKKYPGKSDADALYARDA